MENKSGAHTFLIFLIKHDTPHVTFINLDSIPTDIDLFSSKSPQIPIGSVSPDAFFFWLIEHIDITNVKSDIEAKLKQLQLIHVGSLFSSPIPTRVMESKNSVIYLSKMKKYCTIGVPCPGSSPPPVVTNDLPKKYDMTISICLHQPNIDMNKFDELMFELRSKMEGTAICLIFDPFGYTFLKHDSITNIEKWGKCITEAPAGHLTNNKTKCIAFLPLSKLKNAGLRSKQRQQCRLTPFSRNDCNFYVDTYVFIDGGELTVHDTFDMWFPALAAKGRSSRNCVVSLENSTWNGRTSSLLTLSGGVYNQENESLKNEFCYSDQSYDRHIPFIAGMILSCLTKSKAALPESICLAECLTTFKMSDKFLIQNYDMTLYNELFELLLVEGKEPYEKDSYAKLWVKGMSKLINGIYNKRDGRANDVKKTPIDLIVKYLTFTGKSDQTSKTQKSSFSHPRPKKLFKDIAKDVLNLTKPEDELKLRLKLRSYINDNDKHDVLFALCPVLAHLGRTADVCTILGKQALDNIKVIPYCIYAIGIFKNEIKRYLRGMRSVIKKEEHCERLQIAASKLETLSKSSIAHIHMTDKEKAIRVLFIDTSWYHPRKKGDVKRFEIAAAELEELSWTSRIHIKKKQNTAQTGPVDYPDWQPPSTGRDGQTFPYNAKKLQSLSAIADIEFETKKHLEEEKEVQDNKRKRNNKVHNKKKDDSGKNTQGAQMVLFDYSDWYCPETKEKEQSVFHLASDCDANHFLAEDAVADAINKRWWKKFSTSPWYTILFYTLLPFLQKSWRPKQCKEDTNQDGCMFTSCMCCSCCKEKCDESYIVDPYDVKEMFWDIWDIPGVKCMVHGLFFYVLIGLFCHMVLTGLSKKEITYVEWTVFGWMLMLIFEEIIQLLGCHFLDYIGQFWNRLDFLLLLLYAIGCILRFVDFYKRPNIDLLEAARVIYAIDAFLLFLRGLQFFGMQKQSALHLITIRSMAKDLFHFMIILATVLIGYGVALQAILSPESSLNSALLNSVLHIPYIQIFGELSIDEILSSTNDTDPHAYLKPSVTNYIGIVLVGCYLLFTNILLINLLIARFGWTYSDILANAQHTCAKEMAVLLDEFEQTFTLPGPFSIVKRITKYLWQDCDKSAKDDCEDDTSNKTKESSNVGNGDNKIIKMNNDLET